MNLAKGPERHRRIEKPKKLKSIHGSISSRKMALIKLFVAHFLPVSIRWALNKFGFCKKRFLKGFPSKNNVESMACRGKLKSIPHSQSHYMQENSNRLYFNNPDLTQGISSVSLRSTSRRKLETSCRWCTIPISSILGKLDSHAKNRKLTLATTVENVSSNCKIFLKMSVA